MALYDFRKKQTHEWTYYVVDDLPTMRNIFRYDSPKEAIQRYKTLPIDDRSAIGASIGAAAELDLVHRGDGNHAILVRDYQNNSDPLWRESKELQDAIDQMITDLQVEYQYDHGIFGKHYPSVAIALERCPDNHLSSYFSGKTLRTSSHTRDGSPNYLSSINEVYVVGAGWLNLDYFLPYLDNSRPSFPGDTRKTVYVEQLNVQYVTENGEHGQADLHPHEFKRLREKTDRLVQKGSLEEKIHLAKQSSSWPCDLAESVETEERDRI